MAVEYKPSNTKAELLEIAAANGVAASDEMTKAQILAALDVQNGTEGAKASEGTTTTTDGKQPMQGAQDGTEGAKASAGTTTTTDGKQPTQGAQDGTEGAKASEGTTTTTDGKQPTQGAQDGTENMSEYTMFIYAGPSLPNGRLKENAVFRGTIEDVKNYLADVLEDYPQAEKLIVPTCKIAAFSVKVKTAGNVANKYYNDIVSTMRNHKEV